MNTLHETVIFITEYEGRTTYTRSCHQDVGQTCVEEAEEGVIKIHPYNSTFAELKLHVFFSVTCLHVLL